MSEMFLEKAFWFLAALVVSLFTVCYKAINGGIKKDRIIANAKLKDEIQNEIKEYISISVMKDFTGLKDDVSKLAQSIDSFKKHENNNYESQSIFLRKIIKKLDSKNPNLVEQIIEED